MIVVGGNVTFNCSLPLDSPAPSWGHKAPNATSQSDFKVVHSGLTGISARYPTHFAVDVGETTARKFSYLTLTNATPEFAGKYKCREGSSPRSFSEELVVLGEYFVYLNAPCSSRARS